MGTLDSIYEKNFPWQGNNKIYDIDLKKASDLDDTEMDLFKGKYEMGLSKLDVMIRKGDNINQESYDVLRTFRHGSAIPLLDIYLDHEKHLSLILPEVDGTFRAWFKLKGHSALFDSNQHMSDLMVNLTVEFASLIENLLKSNLIIENFSMNNIFVKVLKDSLPKLCILLTEVKKVKVVGAVDKRYNWDCVRTFISWCEAGCGVQRNRLTKSFCKFFGSSLCTAEKMRYYPHNWNWEMKGQYLMALVAGHHGQIRGALSRDWTNQGSRKNGEKFDWPYQGTGRNFNNLPKIFQQLLDWEFEVNGREYNTKSFFDYIILLRNCFKHYKTFPEDIKVVLRDQQSVIRIIDIWSPKFWTRIYKRVGWPNV